jgi:prefoldin subunit 5
MKEERELSEKINLLKKEIQTLVSEIQRLDAALSAVEDVKLELKGIKLFLGRKHPDLKDQLPEIVRKLKANKPSD